MDESTRTKAMEMLAGFKQELPRARNKIISTIRAIAMDEPGEEEDKLVMRLANELEEYCTLRGAIQQVIHRLNY